MLTMSSSCFVGSVSSGSSSNLVGSVTACSGDVLAKVGKRAPPAATDRARERKSTTTRMARMARVRYCGGADEVKEAVAVSVEQRVLMTALR